MHKDDVEYTQSVEVIREIIREYKEEKMMEGVSTRVQEPEVYNFPANASELIVRLDDREKNVEDFVSTYGLGPLVNLFNELSDEICKPDGRFNKGVDKALQDWYVAAGKSIKYHYGRGVAR